MKCFFPLLLFSVFVAFSYWLLANNIDGEGSPKFSNLDFELQLAKPVEGNILGIELEIRNLSKVNTELKIDRFDDVVVEVFHGEIKVENRMQRPVSGFVDPWPDPIRIPGLSSVRYSLTQFGVAAPKNVMVVSVPTEHWIIDPKNKRDYLIRVKIPSMGVVTPKKRLSQTNKTKQKVPGGQEP